MRLGPGGFECQGPEAVFWARGQTPPRGTYVVCLLAQGFDPPMGETAPVDCTLRIRSNGQDVPPSPDA
ncbi:hypothetical protein LXT21_31355 [Myxococcus sp. K38C18041901]|uniref:hypothetical protein n=1 Tax=Myxococcus guangdongensis TaxID=2906760 RepID=UPI0020A7A175|nr:hypothetical protein [Myxococcus guangdongensis]MCP3063285.1 hypothetical protein [Myxococcus guangdongensis]